MTFLHQDVPSDTPHVHLEKPSATAETVTWSQCKIFESNIVYDY